KIIVLDLPSQPCRRQEIITTKLALLALRGIGTYDMARTKH
ncbi:MAG: hypothetical protein ACJAXV_001625, partial [Bacteroidia bacterium]